MRVKYGRIVGYCDVSDECLLLLHTREIIWKNRKMSTEPLASTRRLNLEQCIYCAHYEALGCGGGTRFCMYYDVFLMHDPACKEQCPDRSPIEGAR
jgi:hypothetical protein